MRHTYIHTTYTSKLNYTVYYSCPYCGTANGYPETMALKGSTPGKTMYSKEKKSFVSLTSEQYFLKQLSSIGSGGFRKMRLNAICKSCGKRPAWACYPRKTLHIFALVFGLLLLSLVRPSLISSAPIHRFAFVFLGVGLILLFLSLPLYYIRRKKRDRMISEMTPDQLPHVFVGDKAIPTDTAL